MATGKIFVCYRREDSSGHAGRLYDRLNQRFPGRVFMDVAGIDVGTGRTYWTFDANYRAGIDDPPELSKLPLMDELRAIRNTPPAAATSSSNAILCGSVLLLREAIDQSRYDWKKDGPNLPEAMLADRRVRVQGIVQAGSRGPCH